MPLGQPTLQEIVASAAAGTRYLGNQFARNNRMLQLMPFDNSVTPGRPEQILAYNYSRQKNMRLGQLRDWYQDYTPGFVDREELTTKLRPMGEAFEIDRVFADADISGYVEMNVAEIALATGALLNNLTINGDSAGGSLEFDGLNKILTGTTSEVDGGAINLAAGRTDGEYLEGVAGLKKYINRIRALGLTPVVLTNEEATLRVETVGTKLGFVQKSTSTFGDDITRYGGADLVDLGVVPSELGDGDSIVPAVGGVTDIYIVGFGLQGFHGVTLSGTSGVKYYSNLGNTDPGVTKRIECELVATVALKNTKAAYVLRDVRIAPAPPPPAA